MLDDYILLYFFLEGDCYLPRKARSTVVTNFPHIIVQGINKNYIFKEKYFKELYLNLIKKYLEDTDIEILAYCVMDNHAHIMLYLEKLDELGPFMQKVNTSFAVKYNKIKNRVGFVFRNRFYLQPINSERQIYNCLVYIHRNPIKANIVSKYEEYEFSSYKEFFDSKNLLTDKGIKLIFGSNTNFLKTFEQIHKDQIVEDVKDVQEYRDSNEVIKDYLKKYGKSIDEIKKDNILLKELIVRLKEESGLSLRKMDNLFNIRRNKLSKILNVSEK